jgi:hypothetical protein
MFDCPVTFIASFLKARKRLVDQIKINQLPKIIFTNDCNEIIYSLQRQMKLKVRLKMPSLTGLVVSGKRGFW